MLFRLLFEVAVNTTGDIKETVEHLVNSYLALTFGNLESRSEERRVGKEGRTRGSPYH